MAHPNARRAAQRPIAAVVAAAAAAVVAAAAAAAAAAFTQPTVTNAAPSHATPDTAPTAQPSARFSSLPAAASFAPAGLGEHSGWFGMELAMQGAMRGCP